MRKLVLFIALSLAAADKPAEKPKEPTTEELKKAIADQKSKIEDLEKQVRSLDARQKVAWANFNRCVEDSVALLAAQPKQ